MGGDRVWYEANVLADFPTHDKIVNLCTKAGSNQNGVDILVAGKPRFWVKYGKSSVIRGEGCTQAHVARIVKANPVSVVRVPEVYLGFSRGKRGYIVMDFVQGTTLAQRKSILGYYDDNDIKAVAAAVQQLTDIKMPAGTAPGPVHGGHIGHDFFVDCLSTLKYFTVGDLEAQINKVLRLSGNNLRVDFTADYLVLCPSDPNGSNFIIDDGGSLWAIDFGRTCFLPSSFVSYSLTRSSDVFVQSVARLVNYPQSANVRAMSAASGQLVIFNNNALGGSIMSSKGLTSSEV
ncbi:unnamed protein product [Cyclocybe aegerita]|uniref:Aminoglycoside phosphotransferase domain-containing protein n=1 Tax=Cyclocybe aegerita TaxID=1973307 RepID=A0A8S0X615_CYCAE|nr:unnamed protein product [Cyclocybe aegerita]